MISPPKRKVKFGAQEWQLVLDLRCLYTCEVEGGRPYTQVLVEACNDTKNIAPMVLMLWGMTAQHREKTDDRFTLTEHEKTQPYSVPPSFVDLLPFGSDWDALQREILEMIRESGLVSYSKPKPLQPAPPIEFEPEDSLLSDPP